MSEDKITEGEITRRTALRIAAGIATLTTAIGASSPIAFAQSANEGEKEEEKGEQEEQKGKEEEEKGEEEEKTGEEDRELGEEEREKGEQEEEKSK